MAGWIKLHRGLLNWKFANKPDYVAVWVNLLLSASHDGYDTAQGNTVVHVKRGQVVTGRKRISKETGVQEMKVERIINVLISEQQIEQQTFTKYRLISICKWDSYQVDEQQNEQQTNNKRTTNEQQTNTIKNDKNEKKKEIPSSSGDEAGAKVADFFVTKKKKKMTGPRLDSFLQFWEIFNYKSGKAEAADAWLEIPLLNKAVVSQILSAAKIEAQGRDAIRAAGKTPKMAQGWISGRRWEDEAAAATPSPEDKLTTMDPAKAEAIRRKLAKYDL